MQRSNQLAVVGLALALPACLVCLSGLLRFRVPGVLIHPALVMGRLLTALALNLLRMKAKRENGSLVGAVSLRIEGVLLNLAVVTMSLSLTAVILMYLLVENFQPL
jgi:cobalamin biosynthesis protein CobD/CbiB